MEAIYPYAHIIHLLLAIAFLGYVFSDVVMLSALKNRLGKETESKITQILGAKSFKIFPLALLFIVLTGGMMLSKYINSDAGVFETGLQKLLMFKVVLALLIVLGVLYNLYTKFTNKSKHPFMQEHFHKVVLLLGLCIVILAKMMFVVSN